MFEYFTGPKYVWNLGVCATLNNGGAIDEVDRACRPARDAPDVDSGSRIFMQSWKAVADQAADQARASEAAGHLRTAGQQWYRSGLYVCQAERMLSNTDPGRRAFYQQALDAFEKVFELADPATSRVEVPFEGTTLPAYFSNASRDGEPAPCVIMWNGLDSTKEHMYTSGWAQEMRERGISVLMVDNPGSGEALRFGDLKARIESEQWASAQVDYLESRSDVDSDRIGLVGWSLGGYYCPRAAAFEKRLKLVAVWGANHNWGEVQKRRLQREGENPVPHYWDHVLWVWGFDDVEKFAEYAEGVNLDGVVEQITVPFLIAHGANDRQIPVEYAHRSYDQAVNSPKRELRIFTVEEGAAEHVGLDHMPHINAFIADWVEDTFVELSSAVEESAQQPSRDPQPVSLTRAGTMATDRPARYAKQLAGHWARKGSSAVEDGVTVIRFDGGQVVRLRPADGVLHVEASVPGGGDPDRFAQVVKDHLERFGQRDELEVVWGAAPWGSADAAS